MRSGQLETQSLTVRWHCNSVAATHLTASRAVTSGDCVATESTVANGAWWWLSVAGASIEGSVW